MMHCKFVPGINKMTLYIDIHVPTFLRGKHFFCVLRSPQKHTQHVFGFVLYVHDTNEPLPHEETEANGKNGALWYDVNQTCCCLEEFNWPNLADLGNYHRGSTLFHSDGTERDRHFAPFLKWLNLYIKYKICNNLIFNVLVPQACKQTHLTLKVFRTSLKDHFWIIKKHIQWWLLKLFQFCLSPNEMDLIYGSLSIQKDLWAASISVLMEKYPWEPIRK